MGGSYTVFSHTADTGITVDAETFGELLVWAARGMFELMYDVGAGEAARELAVDVAAASPDDLVVDVLSELLYLSEAHDVIPCRFDVATTGDNRAHLTVGVVPMRPELLHGPPIKAVTYHDLLVDEADDGTWHARVVFDV